MTALLTSEPMVATDSALALDELLMSVLPRLRYQRVLKRVRAFRGEALVVDSTRAVLFLEPMRVVPCYGVPAEDVLVGLEPAQPGPPPTLVPIGFGPRSPKLLDPRTPFAAHTAAGRPFTVAGTSTATAFALDPFELGDYVLLDFDAFQWFEEDEPIMGHPRDPFHRIDVRRSSRHVRIESDGVVLAESSRARMLFEGTFPLPRYYLPIEDVQVELRPGTLDTTCAYKGHATHLTATADGRELPNIAWMYEEPLSDAVEVQGMVSFYQERLTTIVDGVLSPPVRTPWS